MRGLFSRFFKVQPNEGRLVLILGLLLFGNSFVLEINEIVATSGFVSELSLENILPVWALSMGLIVISGALQSFIVDRYDRKSVLGGLCLVIALIYTVLGWLFQNDFSHWLTYSFLFVLSDQQWLFFPLIFWVLANDQFSMAQAKRLFPLIISLSFLGQITGIAVSATAPNLLAGLHLTSFSFLMINAVTFVILFFVIRFFLPLTKRNVATSQANSISIRNTLTEGWEFVRNVPSFRFMGIAYLGLAVAITIARFHFLVVSGRELSASDQFQTFYGICRLLIVSLSMLMTGLVMGQLMKWLRLQDVFFITPGGIGIILLSMLLISGLIVSAGGIILVWVLYNSVDQSARKALQSLIPEEKRGRVSVFIESYVPALGVIMAAGLINALIRLMPLIGLTDVSPVYLGLGVIAALFSIWAVLKLRQVYDSSLLNWRMNRRKRGSSVLEKLEL